MPDPTIQRLDEKIDSGGQLCPAWMRDVVPDDTDFESIERSSTQFTRCESGSTPTLRLLFKVEADEATSARYQFNCDLVPSAWAPAINVEAQLPRRITAHYGSGGPEWTSGILRNLRAMTLKALWRRYDPVESQVALSASSRLRIEALYVHILGGFCYGPNEDSECPSAILEPLIGTFGLQAAVPGDRSAVAAIRSVPRIGPAIAERLQFLDQQHQEEDPDAGGLSPGSSYAFLSFLRAFTDLKLPSISLTPDGAIYASWREPGGRTFSVHFLSTGEAKYVLFRPAPNAGAQKIRSSGSAPANMLLNIAETSPAYWVRA
jgi:hypothetical protein